MDKSGITSQYGFLFQRVVFVLYVLENMNVKQNFYFEGKDDVEISVNDKIYELYTSSSHCVQVKSGVVDSGCFNKVIGNWLLLNDSEKVEYTLFVENELKIEWSVDSIVHDVFDFISAGKTKKKNAIARKVYEKYKDDIEKKNAEKLKDDIKGIIEKMKLDKCSMDELCSRLEKVYFENHCQDIKDYEIAKKKRLEKFIYYINKQIDDSVKQKKTYSLSFSELMKILMQAFEEVNDYSYKANIALLKPAFAEKAKRIVEEKKTREVKQLFLVNSEDAFVIKGIVNELFYKDFRENFADTRALDVSNIEAIAKDNHENVFYELEGDIVPKMVYDATVAKSIDSDLLPKGPMYQNGCYIYLTGKNINKEIQITWGEDGED